MIWAKDCVHLPYATRSSRAVLHTIHKTSKCYQCNKRHDNNDDSAFVKAFFLSFFFGERNGYWIIGIFSPENNINPILFDGMRYGLRFYINNFFFCENISISVFEDKLVGLSPLFCLCLFFFMGFFFLLLGAFWSMPQNNPHYRFLLFVFFFFAFHCGAFGSSLHNKGLAIRISVSLTIWFRRILIYVCEYLWAYLRVCVVCVCVIYLIWKACNTTKC